MFHRRVDILKRSASSAAAIAMLAIALIAAGSGAAEAQFHDLDGRYHPFNHAMPPGVVGYWMGALGRARPGYLQPIRVDLPSEGEVAFFAGRPAEPRSADAPAIAAVSVGHTYRVRISDMPEFPGVELYPTLEVIDSLHAPDGAVNEFPIPVPITEADVEQVLRGKLVTKVVYVEQPQLVSARELQSDMPTSTLPPSHNLLAAADLRGRPLMILRIGGRLPDPQEYDPRFYGTGGPVVFPAERSLRSPNIDARSGGLGREGETEWATAVRPFPADHSRGRAVLARTAQNIDIP